MSLKMFERLFAKGKNRFVAKISELTPPKRGEVLIRKRFADGSTETIVEDKNLIVNDGKQIMAWLLGGKDTAEPISYIKFGTGGIMPDQDDQKKARVPVIGETDLQEPIDSETFSVTPDFSISDAVTFGTTVPKTSLVGEGLSEIGLFTASGKMFSIKTFGMLTKEPQYVIEVFWKIKF